MSSNFVAQTRLAGTDNEFKEAIWIDNYYGPGEYGVRFRGTIHFIHGRDCEFFFPSRTSQCSSCHCSTHSVFSRGHRYCGKCWKLKDGEDDGPNED